MDAETSLSVIVPVYNEQYLVQASLSRLLVLAESPVLRRIQIIVVDDGSSDDTRASLDEFQQSIAEHEDENNIEWFFLRHEKNRGKGAALRTGLEHADTELTVIHDADLEYHPSDLLKMVPLFLKEGADAVYGSRFLAGEYRRVLFFRHALGNRTLTFLCDLIADANISDVETCYKMVRTDLLKSIPLVSSDFRIEIELTVKLAKRGARIFEVPISYSGRTYQEGKKINWKDGLLALVAILKYAVSDHIYAEDKHGGEILSRLNRAPRFNLWMADCISPYVGHRVLEIGAGVGNITRCLIPRKVYWATDVNTQYVDRLHKLGTDKPYLRTGQTDVTKGDSFPSDELFDTAICLNVIEHVEDDVAALRNIGRSLKPGGRAIILVPHGPRLYNSLDRVLGHYRRYTRKQLLELAKECGFCVSKLIPFNRAGVLGWWLNGSVLRRETFALGQIKVLNLLVPLLRRVDSWIPLPPLSLIAVLEKGSALNKDC